MAAIRCPGCNLPLTSEERRTGKCPSCGSALGPGESSDNREMPSGGYSAPAVEEPVETFGPDDPDVRPEPLASVPEQQKEAEEARDFLQQFSARLPEKVHQLGE